MSDLDELTEAYTQAEAEYEQVAAAAKQASTVARRRRRTLMALRAALIKAYIAEVTCGGQRSG